MNPGRHSSRIGRAYQFRVVPEGGDAMMFDSDFATLAFEGNEPEDEDEGDEGDGDNDPPDPGDDVTVQPADSVLNPSFTEEWVGNGSHDDDDVGDVLLDRELYSTEFHNMAAFSDVAVANDDETATGSDFMVV